jgi:hypothetical protein
MWYDHPTDDKLKVLKAGGVVVRTREKELVNGVPKSCGGSSFDVTQAINQILKAKPIFQSDIESLLGSHPLPEPARVERDKRARDESAPSAEPPVEEQPVCTARGARPRQRSMHAPRHVLTHARAPRAVRARLAAARAGIAQGHGQAGASAHTAACEQGHRRHSAARRRVRLCRPRVWRRRSQ